MDGTCCIKKGLFHAVFEILKRCPRPTSIKLVYRGMFVKVRTNEVHGIFTNIRVIANVIFVRLHDELT